MITEEDDEYPNEREAREMIHWEYLRSPPLTDEQNRDLQNMQRLAAWATLHHLDISDSATWKLLQTLARRNLLVGFAPAEP